MFLEERFLRNSPCEVRENEWTTMTKNARVRCLAIALSATFALAGCGSGGSGGGGTTPPPNIMVSVSPQLAAVAATTQTQQFTSVVTGAGDSSVTWSVDGVANGNTTAGMISTNG